MWSCDYPYHTLVCFLLFDHITLHHSTITVSSSGFTVKLFFLKCPMEVHFDLPQYDAPSTMLQMWWNFWQWLCFTPHDQTSSCLSISRKQATCNSPKRQLTTKCLSERNRTSNDPKQHKNKPFRIYTLSLSRIQLLWVIWEMIVWWQDKHEKLNFFIAF